MKTLKLKIAIEKIKRDKKLRDMQRETRRIIIAREKILKRGLN